MKKITLILWLTILFSSISYAQKDGSYEKALQYLREKGEVIFTFKANSKQQFFELSEFLSISHKRVDENLLEVEAYANKEQFQRFLTYGLAYRVAAEDNEIPQEYTQYATQAVGAWDTTWDAYPKYSEYVAKMQFWAANYPSLCTLQSIGTTPNGRTLYVLKISDNVASDETEPEFFYSSSMHGDEITGYPIMLRFIDYLLTNYGTLSEVTNILNSTELFICPLANPDGSYRTAGNDTMNTTGNTATRANANNIDLNRNYPDPIGGIHPDNAVYQPETVAFLNFEATRHFVLSANYHGGAEVFNFPWDTSNAATGSSAVSIHPHDNYFKFVAQEYAQTCQTADGNANYMDDVYGSGQFPGTTNGAIWYTVKGGRQDCNNFFNHNKESTIEVSAVKFPAASNLPFHWDRNRQAMLNYIKQANYGLHGVVTDPAGNPIHAKVYISGTLDGWGSWVETSPTRGDYHKLQIAGTYNVIFEAPGYTSQTITVTLTNNATTTLNVTMVPTTSIPTASDVTICTGQTAALSATGAGTIRWYNSATSTTPLASTANYTTPALTSTTSYWVEREVTLANVGPTTVSGTATSNTTVANKFLIFNCTTPTKLKSVLITASAAGQILVELQNSSGTMIESKVIRLSASGAQDIPLDFFIPVGTGLRLVSRQISAMNITCATSGITYPYNNGTISITGNGGTGTFFQFFNWKFEPVKSNRDEVIVTVTPNPTNASVNPNTRTAGSGAFTLTVNGTNFISGQSVVRWNGANRTTTFVSSTQLTAAINAADVATAGTANVTVFNTCNSTTTSAQTVTITGNCTAPVPNVTNLPNIMAQCSATVTPPTATSNCYGQITATTPMPLTYNAQGSYQIYWTYNDGNGGISNQYQNVIISDTTAPVANVTNLPTVTGQCSVTVTPPTATDNCMGTITATTSDPLTYSSEGSYNIIWTYTDNRGNQAFQAQTVVVSDTIAPVPNVANLPTITAQCSTTLTPPTATDNCSGTITATTTNPTTYNTQGTFTVVWRYTDAKGNFTNQNQTVVINDTTAPVPNVANLPIITAQCATTLTAPTATDNCSGAITATTTNPTTYNTQGTFTVVWRYTDARGNFTNQNQTVVINDTTAPVPSVANLPTITAQCATTLTAPTATDNCSGTITATTTNPTTYNTQGTYTVVWRYTDARGNFTNQNQTVIITNGGPIVTFYRDFDGDGFGNINITATGCVAPSGFVSNNTDCNDSSYSITNTCVTTVNLKLFFEGYYAGGGTMTSAMLNRGSSSNPNHVDSIQVELRDPNNFNLVDSVTTSLLVNGTAACNFTTAPSGTFYVVVKAGGAVETWTANPITVGTNPVSYDFSNQVIKAYGSNMKEMEPGIWAFYSGDINGDGSIDNGDYSMWEMDSNNFAFGDYDTDLNGDGNVDNGDYSIWEVNANNFIFKITPQ